MDKFLTKNGTEVFLTGGMIDKITTPTGLTLKFTNNMDMTYMSMFFFDWGKYEYEMPTIVAMFKYVLFDCWDVLQELSNNERTLLTYLVVCRFLCPSFTKTVCVIRSYAQIMEDTGIKTYEEVYDAIYRLKSLGFITVESGKYTGRPNKYILSPAMKFMFSIYIKFFEGELHAKFGARHDENHRLNLITRLGDKENKRENNDGQ